MKAPLCKFCGQRHWGALHVAQAKDYEPEPFLIPTFKGNPKKLIDPKEILPPDLSQLSATGGYGKRFKNGHSYAKKTTIYKHNCQWCGIEFKGSLDKQYCSNLCRLTAFRNFKKEKHDFTTPGPTKPEQLKATTYASWGQKRFFILHRDHFRCRYCGNSPNDGYVLHMDHIYPKSKGGSDDPDNLITSCMECNLAKNTTILQHHPLVEFTTA